jgi:hypothetical protein
MSVRSDESTEVSIFDDFSSNFEERQYDHKMEHRLKYGTDGTKAAKIDFLISEGYGGDDKFHAEAWSNRDRNPQNDRIKRNAIAMRGIVKKNSPGKPKRKYSCYSDKRKTLEQQDTKKSRHTYPKRKIAAEVAMYYRILKKFVEKIPKVDEHTKPVYSFERQLQSLETLLQKGVSSDEQEWLLYERMSDIVEEMYQNASDICETVGVSKRRWQLYIDVADASFNLCGEVRRENECG